MSNRFLQKTGIVLSMLSVQQLCTAQSLSFASQPIPAQHTESRSRAKSLKDFLIDLGRQHQVSILFEEETVKNIMITGTASQQSENKLEKQLSDLLKPLNLRFKKAGKEAYVIVSRSEKKVSEAAIATIEKEGITPVSSETLTGKSDVSIAKINKVNSEDVIVKGTVTDERGDGLPGVSVVIKGSQRGVSTDGSGKYEITGTGTNAVLIFFIRRLFAKRRNYWQS